MFDQFYNYFSELTVPWAYDLFIRLFLAAIAGAIVGIEREYHGRPAGMRTHILVSLGAAMISLISIEMTLMTEPMTDNVRFQVDPGRIVQGVVTGIGFLGAGAIIKIGATARGLTTAASLWCIAIVGMGFGFGIYRIPALGTLLMLFTLMILGRVEKWVEKNIYKTVWARITGSPEQFDQLQKLFKSHNWPILDYTIEYESPEFMNIEIHTRFNKQQSISGMATVLREADYIDRFKIY
jgi:putative Mg2+ transporter-C (MgtC) family protein